jgi:hypothetical protein
MSKIVCFIFLFKGIGTELVFLFTVCFSISLSLLFTADIPLVVTFEGVLEGTHPLTSTGISNTGNTSSLFLCLLALKEIASFALRRCVRFVIFLLGHVGLLRQVFV